MSSPYIILHPYIPEKSLRHTSPPFHSFDLTEQGASAILLKLQRFIYFSIKDVLLNVNKLRMSRKSVSVNISLGVSS
jgi:hypothetical protein